MSWLNGTNKREAKFESVSEILKRVRVNVAKRTEAIEFPFGIKALDDSTGGLPKGKITIIAARTSEGKTSLSLQVACHMAKNDKTVAFISLEDDRESLVERLYCQQGKLDNFKLRNGDATQLDDPETNKLLENIRLLVLDDFGYNFDELVHVMETLDPKPDVVFIDYVQMIDQGQKESEYEAVSKFVRQAKIFAERYKIAVVLVSQINRQGARDGRPDLHHLASCGRLEQVANLVLIMYTPYFYGQPSFDYVKNTVFGMEKCPDDYTEVEVAKNKTGSRSLVVPLKFVGSQYRFDNWTEPYVRTVTTPEEVLV